MAPCLDQAPRPPVVLPRVLWIDDEELIRRLVATVLARSDIYVETVGLGLLGLERGCAQSWNLIGLDLTLPDLDGVEVLRRMRERGVAAPVLVLTGYWDDAERLNRAWRAGATECQPKRLSNQELLTVVRRLVREGPCRGSETVTTPIASLLAWLDLASTRPADRGGDPRQSTAIRDLQSRLLAALVDPSTTIPSFHACATAFRRTLSPGESPAVPADLSRAIRAADQASRPDHAQVQAGVTILEGLTTDPPGNLEAVVAGQVNLSPSHFGRLLEHFTGLDFRSWIRLGRVRAAVRELARSSEHVRQIAIATHWSSHGGFDKCCHETFGLSPTGLRHRLRHGQR